MAVAARKRAIPEIVINEAWCKQCGICIATCPTKVFDAKKDGTPVVARHDACTWCELCELKCPDFAITLRGDRHAQG